MKGKGIMIAMGTKEIGVIMSYKCLWDGNSLHLDNKMTFI